MNPGTELPSHSRSCASAALRSVLALDIAPASLAYTSSTETGCGEASMMSGAGRLEAIGDVAVITCLFWSYFSSDHRDGGS